MTFYEGIIIGFIHRGFHLLSTYRPSQRVGLSCVKHVDHRAEMLPPSVRQPAPLLRHQCTSQLYDWGSSASLRSTQHLEIVTWYHHHLDGLAAGSVFRPLA